MFNPFKLYDEMLGIYVETVKGGKDDLEPNLVLLEYEVPEDVAGELDTLVCNWLTSKGIELDEEADDAS